MVDEGVRGTHRETALSRYVVFLQLQARYLVFEVPLELSRVLMIQRTFSVVGATVVKDELCVDKERLQIGILLCVQLMLHRGEI